MAWHPPCKSHPNIEFLLHRSLKSWATERPWWEWCGERCRTLHQMGRKRNYTNICNIQFDNSSTERATTEISYQQSRCDVFVVTMMRVLSLALWQWVYGKELWLNTFAFREIYAVSFSYTHEFKGTSACDQPVSFSQCLPILPNKYIANMIKQVFNLPTCWLSCIGATFTFISCSLNNRCSCKVHYLTNRVRFKFWISTRSTNAHDVIITSSRRHHDCIVTPNESAGEVE